VGFRLPAEGRDSCPESKTSTGNRTPADINQTIAEEICRGGTVVNARSMKSASIGNIQREYWEEKEENEDTAESYESEPSSALHGLEVTSPVFTTSVKKACSTE